MNKRIVSIIVIIAMIMTNTLGSFVPTVYAEGKTKKVKFIIKHADNERMKNKFFPDEATVEEEIISELSFDEVSDDIVTVEAILEELEELIADPEILSVEVDNQVNISADYSLNLISIGEDRIDDLSFDGEGIKIAILDTGIDTSNTDINIKGGISFIDNTDFNDDNGHGTALASIIGAQDNGDGLVGIAPGAELYAVKVLDENGTGYYSDIIKGLEWCIDNRIDIVLMSFGAEEYSGMLHESIQKAYFQDALLIGATGNTNELVQFPAAFTEVMAIGGVNENDESLYSNTNAALIDLYAIGSNVSTYGLTGEEIQAGTSFSAAHVAGVAAELWSLDALK